MRAGLLRDKISITKTTTKLNDYGEPTIVDSIIYTTKAMISSVSDKKTSYGEVFTVYQKQFVIRSYCKLDENCSILYKDKAYRILSIDKSVSKQNITIIAELIND